MFPVDCLVFDVIIPASARPTPEQVQDGLGGAEATEARAIIDVDLDLPQLEQELSPTLPLRRRGDRRILIADEATAPLRPNRTSPIVARDLRPERERLVRFVEKTGSRIGRMSSFGTWGDAVVVTRSPRDLRAVALLSWVLDPTVDLEGRRRASQLSQREFDMKLGAYDKRLDELDDQTILARVPPGTIEIRGTKDAPIYVLSALSDRDGSWDIRKSYELEKKLGAAELFSRIPGARQSPLAPAEPAPAPVPAAEPEPPPPPKPQGPPITAAAHGDRVILKIPGDRLDSETVTALGRRAVEALAPGDAVDRRERERMEQAGAGFVAPLAFLSEVFLEGKPLDRKRFAEGAVEVAPGVKAFEAHLPRYGGVWVLEVEGKRWVTSEIGKTEAVLGTIRAWG
jgi:hypothetical protein